MNLVRLLTISKFPFVVLQYVALGPRVKIIILNILPVSKRCELNFSLKIALMFLTIILKWQFPN